MNDEIIKSIKNSNFLKGLDHSHVEQVCKNSKALSFKKDDLIFYQGQEAVSFFFIIRGWVSIVKENPDAEQSILHVFKKGDSFAEPAAIIMGEYPASAYAATTCELLEINVSSLKNLIQKDPDIAMRMIARLSQQLNMLIVEYERYKTMSVPRRLAIFLLEILDNEENKKSVNLPFNKTVLAAHLGIQPGTLSRAFNQLSGYGINSDRSGHIVFEDIQKLKEFINSSSPK